MKKLLPIFAFILMFSGFAQEKEASVKPIFNNDLRRANAYFERADYAKAIPFYEKVNTKQRITQVVENLATCYYNIGDLKSSARLYGYLVNSKRGNKTDQNVFKYIQALKASGNYKDANSVSREFLAEKGDVSVLKTFDAEVVKQENIMAIGNRYNLENLAINTENSEFGMLAYQDNLVYAASRKEVHKKNIFSKYYGWNNQPFLDIYKINKDSVSKGNTASESISEAINTKLHEGSVAFTQDLKTIYFTRNNYTKGKEIKDDKSVTHLKIYKAELIDSVWTNIEALPFNGDDFSVEHPALSPDGTRLYFASDMPGTLGEFDLFYVDVKGDGTYGAPVNLGAAVNTEHREQFPFIADNGDLYFSSNGQFGFGGLDVFWAKKSGTSFQKPDNLGLPLNSGYDDFAFYLDKTLKSGFVSSNRIKGKGSDDIYSFNESKPLIIENCKQYINGIITDKETEACIANAKVTLTLISEDPNTDLATFTTKEDGAFNTNVNCEITVLVKASANGYQDAERKITIGGERYLMNDASLALVSLASINKKEQEKQQIAFEKERQKEQEKLKQEQVKLKKDAENKKKEFDNIIASEPNIQTKNNRLVIVTADINFDYKLWYIRKDVKKVLQPVVDLLKKYPNMQIEIESHTDIRGNEAYNKDLSQKRATSTKEYLVSKGIESFRITAIGYGESKPLQKCVTEDACSEEEHEINRRSEFVIKQLQ
ncbi:OmpA family protein [Algibacter amylolyticus]|uniref:OmpA family protein n=1 Tax=Algibacter amylolyticus TaxID=1608400 RepID=A0A5M7B4P0_9FLAO|nr:OmpA family protein [Algibacter amylolyticus]KAA5822305.1 OmpA family protein [Algibacter amylolyticus]MBB5269018.1 outer membrane protein OmpA-like peptidoglycan-associated protein/Tol biopolymer transport system component [Algibacter amylolyticus]TSJ73455.1 OmpA family protein [Algibacter amylolyticus]